MQAGKKEGDLIQRGGEWAARFEVGLRSRGGSSAPCPGLSPLSDRVRSRRRMEEAMLDEGGGQGDNEMRITTAGKVHNYLRYAMMLLNEKKLETVKLSAAGNAINKCISVVEILKRKVPQLHQWNFIESPPARADSTARAAGTFRVSLSSSQGRQTFIRKQTSTGISPQAANNLLLLPTPLLSAAVVAASASQLSQLLIAVAKPACLARAHGLEAKASDLGHLRGSSGSFHSSHRKCERLSS
eukprot:470937-Hanusia_phi.AAC.1